MRLCKSGYWAWLTALLILAVSVSLPTQAATLLKPVDEAAQQASFLSFRHQLLKTLERKDVKGLLAIVDKDIKASFGTENGISGFKELWKLDQPASSDIWRELTTVLKMGGSFSNTTTFVAPYVFSQWPETMDAFENAAVLGSNVRIRAKPDLNASILKTVSYEILPVEFGENQHWVTVKLSGGKKGYIASQYIRSSVDYRAFFEKIKGRWQMTVFVAGD